MVGLGGLEPPTSRLSGVRSNHLSYRPTPRSVAEEIEPVEAVVHWPPSPWRRPEPGPTESQWDKSSPAGVPARLNPGPKLQKERE